MVKVNRRVPINKIRLLVFDLDGTLIDSKADLTASVNAVRAQRGLEALSEKTIGEYIGDGALMLLRRAFDHKLDEDGAQKALADFMAHYRAHLLDHTYAYAGAPEMLEKLAERRRLAVLSNKPEGPSRAICEGLGLSGYLMAVYGGNSFSTKKPDPQGAIKLLSEAGARAEEAIMIGDSANDVNTARAAGMYSIGVTYGFAPASLVESKPDISVDTVEELLQLFAESA